MKSKEGFVWRKEKNRAIYIYIYIHTHPLRKVCKSDAQTPQCDTAMSTSVSCQRFGVKACRVRAEVAELASQPEKLSSSCLLSLLLLSSSITGALSDRAMYR